MIQESHYIFLGTVVHSEISDSMSSFFTVKIEEEIQGEFTEDQRIYAESNRLEVGKQYMFFVRKDDSPFWEQPLFLLTDTDTVVSIHDGKITNSGRCDDLPIGLPYTDVASIAATTKTRNAAIVRIAPEVIEISALQEQSDYIFIATVEHVSYPTAIAGGAATLIDIDPLKGELVESELNLVVPRGIIEGQRYLFFRSNGLAAMPSRNNSVYQINTEACTEVLANLNYVVENVG